MSLINLIGSLVLLLSLFFPLSRPLIKSEPQATPPTTLAESPAFSGEIPRFNKIDIQQGLANSRGLSLMQDRQGFMWFGAGEGVDRYDGYDFVHFRYDANDPHSLSGNEIRGIVEDANGTLWVGTYGGGLNQLVPGANASDPRVAQISGLSR
jgi:ligand-binding sensor domain-containing protein